MEGTNQIDAYCERIEPGLWAEPLNAATNLAFLLSAWIMWRRLQDQDLPLAQALVWVLALIGLSSGAWHTLALGWTGAADSLSILIFILIYLYASNRDFWGLNATPALLGVLAFFPFAIATAWLLSRVPFFDISALYWSVALLIGGTAVALRRRAPATAMRLGLGAGVLTLSITVRSLDEILCASLPFGTHFLWHILNAILLGWMIETYRRHRIRAA